MICFGGARLKPSTFSSSMEAAWLGDAAVAWRSSVGPEVGANGAGPSPGGSSRGCSLAGAGAFGYHSGTHSGNSRDCGISSSAYGGLIAAVQMAGERKWNGDIWGERGWKGDRNRGFNSQPHRSVGGPGQRGSKHSRPCTPYCAVDGNKGSGSGADVWGRGKLIGVASHQ